MNSDINILIYLLTGRGIGVEMRTIAAKINTDDCHELDMMYFAENDSLKQHLKLPEEFVILRIEELDDVIDTLK